MNRPLFAMLALVLISATILLATFVGKRPRPVSTFRLRPDDQTVLFAVTPWGEAKQMKKAYQPLLDYLSERVGKKFQLLIMEDYETAIHHIVEGDIDVFVLPPVSYVTARKREPNIQYISTQVRESEGKMFATYKAYIVALRSRFKGWRLEDFVKEPKKYRLGFITKESSSGYAYPMAMMKQKGIDPYTLFKEVRFFENHPQCTDALVKGEIDLGATWEHNLEQAREKYGDLFTVIETTAVIPGIVWVAAADTPKELITKIEAAQLELNNSPLKKEILKETPDKGWQILTPDYYKRVEEILEYVGQIR